MKKMVIFIIVALLAGGGLGYFISYLSYTPVIEDYVAQINSQVNEISRLVQINCNLEQTVNQQESLIQNQESQISGLETESTSLRTQISSLEEQNTSLESDLSKAQEEIDDYEQQISEKSKSIIGLGNRLNEVLSIEVPQHYEWNYNGSWELNIPITLSSYVDYSERTRPRYVAEFVDMAIESESDPCIKLLVNEFREIADTKRWTDRQLANFVASFVQSLPYTVDYDTKSRDEYPRYPVETLFERGGDCEDTSILVAALLDSLGINVILLHLDGDQHIAVGVDVPNTYGTYYEYLGTKYWFLETTAEGFSIGDYPSKLKDDRAYIYPVW
jgi:hypothetical protein